MMKVVFKQRSVLPGFGITLGYTLLYLSVIVLIPLAGLFLKSAELPWQQFWAKVTTPRVLASYKLTFGASLAAAMINAVFGFIVAWTLVRYRFPGKKFFDAMVDLPFALPTAVSGIALTAVWAGNGWLGQFVEPFGVKVVYTQLGIVIAMTFIGLPFVVRTLQPALEDLEVELEEAAASLGATRFQTFRRVILPTILPSLITGFALAFARAVGEYGSVVFIAGNMPMKTEITSLLIIIKLEEGRDSYPAATGIAVVMLVVSFAILLVINLLQYWTSRRHRA